MVLDDRTLVMDIVITITTIITQSMIRVLSFSLALEFGSYKLLEGGLF